MRLKKILTYWLPPILWAALFFPLFNHYLSQNFLYEWTIAVAKWLFPETGFKIGAIAYVVLRKSFHFIEYAILGFLLYRAFRQGRKERWKWAWVIPAGSLAIAYGLLDEYLQRLVPGRNGSLFDWGIDSLGVVLMLGCLFLRHHRIAEEHQTERYRPSFWRALFLKRPLDIMLSFLGIVLSSPLWIVFGLLIWAQDRGPIFYLQNRVGKDGRIFKAIKFRSMIKDAEAGRGAVQAVENDPRVTGIGKVLRATAMDELPQLVNIFKGDMSFVGPRALRPEEKEARGDGQVRRLDEFRGYCERLAVRPGLTGLAQVYLPGDASRRRKFRYDRLYIRRMSFWRDLGIMALSFWISFRGRWESRQKKI